jgi:AAA15 family ATPase/GTPase
LSYIKNLFQCSITTVGRGVQELVEWNKIGSDRIRAEWWGRKDHIDTHLDLIEKFDAIIEGHTAGSAVDPDITWTNMSPSEIATKYTEDYEVTISLYHIEKIIQRKWLKKRKLYKGKTFKSVEWRNEQFENISTLQAQYAAKGNPVFSMDVKKKSSLETFTENERYIQTKESLPMIMTSSPTPKGK